MALINGTALDDVLASTAGVDTLTALGGNDVVYVNLDTDHTGVEKLDGGAGVDRLWFTGGTSLVLIPTKVLGFEIVQIADAAGNTDGIGAFSINAAGVAAVAAGFTLTGNAGANALTGTAGKDLIIGGLGADTIVAGLGADRVVMSVAAGHIDQINAGKLAELNTLVLVGSPAGVIEIDLTRTDGNDSVLGAGDDQLLEINNVADAAIQAGFANVDASGITGNFGIQVTASALKNVIIGTAKDDVFLFGLPAALGTDIIAGGGGNDTLRFTSTIAGQVLLVGATVTSVEEMAVADAAGLTTGTTKLGINALAVKQAMTLTGNDGANALTGGGFNDTLNGNAGADTLVGGIGNDVYEIDSAADWVALDMVTDTKGTDDRIAFSATDTVGGATLVLNTKITGIEGLYLSGTDFDLDGTTALNVDGALMTLGMAIHGNAGANSIAGGKGNDTLVSGGGADTLVGGLGADRIVFDVADAVEANAGLAKEGNTLVLTGTVTGQLAIDLRIGVDDTMSADQYLTDGAVQSGFAHVDAAELDGTAPGGVTVTGSSLLNKITGSELDDFFIFLAPAHLGADLLNGGEGNDTLRFASITAGQTLVIGAKVTNLELAEIADPTGLITGTTALNINAGLVAGALHLRGNDGNNVLTGGKEGDTLQGNLGVDTLTGGLGDDTYLYEKQADFQAGERITDTGGIDTVKFISLVDGEILTLSAVSGIENYAFDAEGVNHIGYNLSAVAVAANVQGNDANNMITGTNVVAQGDTLVGGLGTDTLIGGAGNDRLEGGEGIDSIVGGLGSDIIVMSTVAGEADEINAGTAASEKNVLVLVGEGFGTVVDFRVAAGLDQITSDAQTQIGFDRVDASGMTGEFAGVTVYGRSGVDSIIGSSGIDVFIPGLGNDTIEGGGGNDIWVVYSTAELGLDVYNDSGGTAADYLYVAVIGGIVTIKDTNLNGVDVVALGDPLGVNPAANTANTGIDASANLKPLSMAGNAGNNTMTGTMNGETFFDWGGSDIVNGKEGSDEYVILAAWTAGDRINDTGVNGFDQFYLAVSQVVAITNVNVKGVERFTVSGGQLNEGVGDYIRDITAHVHGGIDLSGFSTPVGINLAGSYGDNLLVGTSLGDTIIGWKGIDTIVGGGGADTITMDVGVDALVDEDDFGDGSADWDEINAGLITEGNLWILVDKPTGVVTIDLDLPDQLVGIVGSLETLTQSGFLHVDASGMRRPGDALDDENFGVVIAGTVGANKLTGTNDHDVFIGRGGGDSLVGGLGNDIFVITSQGEYNAALTFDGGGGDDMVIFSSITAGQTLILSAGKSVEVEAVTIGDETGDTTGTTALNVTASAFTQATVLNGNDGDNSMIGTAHADTLNGNGGADTLAGGAGNDHYVATSGAHVMAGDRITDAGGTDDRFVFTSLVDGDVLSLTALMTGLEKVGMHDGPDTLPGLALAVDISLLPNGVEFTGNMYANTMVGSAFNDTIDGGAGVDTIDAGAGADRIIMRVEAADADNVNGGLSSAEGNTLVLLGDPGADLVFDLTNGTNQHVSGLGALVITNITSIDLAGLEGDWKVTYTGTAAVNVFVGTPLDDVFITDTPLIAGEVIHGGLGHDLLEFNSAVNGDTLTLGGITTVTGLEEVQFGGTANLNFVAGQLANAVKLTANDGNNAITATNVAGMGDTIDGGAGADTIFGLGGSDVITVDAGVDDVVNGGLISATEANKLVLVGTAAAPVVFNLSLLTGDQSTSIGGNQSGFTHFDASELDGTVTVTGSAAANEIGVNVAAVSANADGGAGVDTLILGGTAGGAVMVDLTSLVDQSSSIVGVQLNFENVNAAKVTGSGVNVTGSAGANLIVGSAQADTIMGGAGADIITVDVAGAADTIDAGGLGEGNKLVLTGDIAATPYAVTLRSLTDQIAAMAGNQAGFQHVDASALTGTAGVNILGNGLNNQLTGTLKGDTLLGGAGADTFILGGGVLGDGTADRVVYEALADGGNVAASVASFDRIKEFTAGQDKIDFSSSGPGEFNSANGLYNLDDIADNNSFVWAKDAKADFSNTHEAMLITSAKSGLKTELTLTGNGFGSVVTAINKATLGVIAGAGDDGLILVQAQGGTLAAPIVRTGIYYYQESDGIANRVSAGELTLLGIVEAKLTENDVAFVV
jgi:Ca2+-binding RTX toxin-like protein